MPGAKRAAAAARIAAAEAKQNDFSLDSVMSDVE